MEPDFCEICQRPSCSPICLACRGTEMIRKDNEAKQRAALRQRVSDMSHAVNVCIEPSRQMKELRNVIESKWMLVPINVVEKGIDSITDYLWQKGVMA